MQDLIINENSIKDKIYTIRNMQVMLDRDLAELYGVETKRINEAVKNNKDKFMDDFYFELNDFEFEFLRSKISTTSFIKTRTNPKVFTEQGIYMLATILKSKVASQVTINLIKTFANMRKLISQNIALFERFERIENRLTIHDKNFNLLFKALEDKNNIPVQNIFFDGQIYDAYSFVNDLIKLANSEIVLIDNYIDDTVFTLFSKYPNINFIIYTNNISKQLKLDFEKYSKQYKNIALKTFKSSHDRFLIIDKKDIYHLGASLKDLGKKWFAFSKMSLDSLNLDEIFNRLK
ncbi:ORF6N domain-containing protein [Aliarcobacter cryaerophilus]|jgi:phage regulator Rha-like protein|uniref:ORF6N domain-containing protein n=2 Tax=Aliarcobacter cryaerophilus TaxID=28198 RepID=UPI0021B43346|nr:ORF6N domain-containing protein [Aliarcobacter cryaerophilus]MCT7484434.1 ORF6N domain-containing protein [Aliarcobacter cryaerophilus]MCT7489049.1 ORF6N domain-containing protein [Aliarcobacter cryaerophilus]